MSEADVSHSRAIVLERMGHLQKRETFREARLSLTFTLIPSKVLVPRLPDSIVDHSTAQSR